jgi:hypothetical protein
MPVNNKSFFILSIIFGRTYAIGGGFTMGCYTNPIISQLSDRLLDFKGEIPGLFNRHLRRKHRCQRSENGFLHDRVGEISQVSPLFEDR